MTDVSQEIRAAVSQALEERQAKRGEGPICHDCLSRDDCLLRKTSFACKALGERPVHVHIQLAKRSVISMVWFVGFLLAGGAGLAVYLAG